MNAGVKERMLSLRKMSVQQSVVVVCWLFAELLHFECIKVVGVLCRAAPTLSSNNSHCYTDAAGATRVASAGDAGFV